MKLQTLLPFALVLSGACRFADPTGDADGKPVVSDIINETDEDPTPGDTDLVDNGDTDVPGDTDDDQPPVDTDAPPADSDNDGVLDADDNCPQTFNPEQANNDGDPAGDFCDPDDDNDGREDTQDNCQFDANPGQEDADADSIGDVCDPDLDGDGVLNNDDNCPDLSNALQENFDGDSEGDLCDADDDGDGIDDLTDNCLLLDNPLQADLDGDDIGDLCDDDDDGDTVLDADDNCPELSNGDQSNLDNDGFGDLCDDDIDGDGILNADDNCELADNPLQENLDSDAFGDVCDDDDDNDGALDGVDNCPVLANADQANLDADSFGDACDDDIDGDGVLNGDDNCSLVSNAFQVDLDNDNIGDACDDDRDGDGVANADDNCPVDANPLQEDADLDEVGDACDDDGDNDGFSIADGDCDDSDPLVIPGLLGCATCEFTAEFEWSIPGLSFPTNETFDTISGEQNCNSEWTEYDIIDIDGDGDKDLVISAECSNAPVGEEYWRVFLSDGASFATTGINWPVPGADFDGGSTFDGFSQEISCSGGFFGSDETPTYGLEDLTGDGLPDLVIYDDCPPSNGSVSAVGATEWLYYENTGAGFAAVSLPWAIPGNLYTNFETFDSASAELDCNSGGITSPQPAYLTADVNGDALPDLVVTDECGTISTVGETNWTVFFNNGTGFDASGTSWAVPGGDFTADQPFSTPSDVNCGDGDLRHGLADVDGDGLIDLVVTDDCVAGSGVGSSEWSVYFNDGSNFASAATAWPLPSGYGNSNGSNKAFRVLAEESPSCANGANIPGYGLVDVDADGLPELLINATCAADDVGELEWLAHRNLGDSFGDTGLTWGIPGDQWPDAVSFEGFSDGFNCDGNGNGDPTHDVTDMDGDGYPDLVIADDCELAVNNQAGEIFWRVYSGACIEL